MAKQNPDLLRRVLAPKVSGMQNLKISARAWPTFSFVAFSTIAALLGNGGQSNYAAANAAMEALGESGSAQVRLQLVSIIPADKAPALSKPSSANK